MKSSSDLRLVLTRGSSLPCPDDPLLLILGMILRLVHYKSSFLSFLVLYFPTIIMNLLVGPGAPQIFNVVSFYTFFYYYYYYWIIITLLESFLSFGWNINLGRWDHKGKQSQIWTWQKDWTHQGVVIYYYIKLQFDVFVLVNGFFINYKILIFNSRLIVFSTHQLFTHTTMVSFLAHCVKTMTLLMF